MSREVYCSGAKTFRIAQFPDNRVRLELTFASAYEAAVACQDLIEAANQGFVELSFAVAQVRERGK